MLMMWHGLRRGTRGTHGHSILCIHPLDIKASRRHLLQRKGAPILCNLPLDIKASRHHLLQHKSSPILGIPPLDIKASRHHVPALLLIRMNDPSGSSPLLLPLLWMGRRSE